ncbi:MAG TPA: imelysin family protein [Pelobium sp.]|nr:imelysin family protein [Pelobium sp.]
MQKAQLNWIKGLCLGLLALVFFVGCGKDSQPTKEEDSNAIDRKALLANLADNIIVPAYADFKLKFDVMLAKSDAFAAQPNNANLLALRTAWQEAYITWQKVELFDFGPGQTFAIRSQFNIYPTSETVIQSNITSGTANLDLPANYAAQGFPALDYLINGVANSDAEIVTYYSTGADATKRVNYLKKVIAQMNTTFTSVYNAWEGDFAETFKSKTAIDAGSSTSTLINGFVLNYERYIRSGKIGIPAGVLTPGTTFPEKVEAFYKKDLSLTLAKTAQQASFDFYNGKAYNANTTGYSIKSYLTSLGAKDATSGKLLADIIAEQFEACARKLDALNNNLNSQVINNNQPMVDAFNEMQILVKLLKVDMTSAMSITISYTDNDGD